MLQTTNFFYSWEDVHTSHAPFTYGSFTLRPRLIQVSITCVQNPMEICMGLCLLRSMDPSTSIPYKPFAIGLCLCLGVCQCKHTSTMFKTLCTSSRKDTHFGAILSLMRTECDAIICLRPKQKKSLNGHYHWRIDASTSSLVLYYKLVQNSCFTFLPINNKLC